MRAGFVGTVENGVCPYLPGRRWRAEEVWVEEIAAREYLRLLDHGFRRCGRLVYRPRCNGCSECRALRVDVRRFAPRRWQRRCLARNADLSLEVGAPGFSREKLELHNQYMAWRHGGAALGADAYRMTFVDSPVDTLELCLRKKGELLAVGIVDHLGDAVSAVFTSYRPDAARRGPGTYLILREVELARRTGATWLHLGYCVQGCPAMAYKSRFQPCEVLGDDGRWRPAAAGPVSETTSPGPR